ncbi:hypothetical protein Tco_1095719 [Tanacetum coccineum]
MLQAPPRGYEVAIILPEINANFELKHILPALTTEVSELKNMMRLWLMQAKSQAPHVKSGCSRVVYLVEVLILIEIVQQRAMFIEKHSRSSLPSNTVTNPKEDLKDITTRSGVVYQGPTIPTSYPKVVELSEPNVALVSAPMPNPKPSIPYPSRRNDKRHRENANEQKEKFYEIFNDMSFEISFMDALTLMPKFASTRKALIGNKEKLSEMARTPLNEHCSAVILNKLPEKLGDPGRFLIPCKFPGMDDDFLLLEEADAFLALADKVDESYYDPEGKELKLCEAKTAKSSIDEPLEVELKELPPHLEYAFLEDNNKLPVIIAKDLNVDEKTSLIKVLKS